MNKSDLLLTLVRANWATRLQDRTFWGMIFSVTISLWLHIRLSIDGQTCLIATTVAIGGWSGIEQINKGVLGSAALKSAAPDTMNIAGDVNTTPPAPVANPSAPVEAALPPTRHGYAPEPTEDF